MLAALNKTTRRGAARADQGCGAGSRSTVTSTTPSGSSSSHEQFVRILDLLAEEISGPIRPLVHAPG